MMRFELQSATKCNMTSQTNSDDFNAEVALETQFNVFFFVNLLSFVTYTLYAIYCTTKSNCKMDPKGWANVGVNIMSFGIKAIAWSYMLSIYDKAQEAL